jgi:hypothetical protein
MEDEIVIIGSRPISTLAADMIHQKTGREVIVVDNPFANEPLPFKSFHVPEILKPSEPNNRRARRKNLRINKRKHKSK